MKLNNIDLLGALLLLVISLAYGYFAFDIALLPGDEYEAFNSRTLPFILSFLGVFLVALEVFFALKKTATDDGKSAFTQLRNKNFFKFLKLIGLVCLYAFSLKYLGFLLSTIAFVFCCSWTLDERNPKTLLLSSVIFVMCFWVLLKFGLDVYMESGSIFK